MNIESFIYAAFGLLCFFRLGLALRDWSRSLPITPDPWDAEITEKLKQPDCVPVCHHCFTPQLHNKWFCPECGAAVGPYNNCLPYIHIFSEGEVLRNGLRNHLAQNPLTVVGYLFFSTLEYLVFAPIYWYLFFRNLRQSTQREQAGQDDPPPPISGIIGANPMKTTIVTLLLFALTACGHSSKVAKEIFGDQQRLDSFLASQQVTAQRLHARPYDGISVGIDSYDKGPPIQVAPAQVQEIKDLLQSPSSYPWDTVNACLPVYGVLLTFHNNQRTIRIAFCYQYNQLGIVDGDKTHHLNSVEDFDPIRTQLVAVAKAIFPKDSEI